MPSSGNRRLRFGIIADIHYTPENSTGAATSVAPDLDRCLSHWREKGAEFVVQLGDLISREGPEAERDLVEVKSMLERFPGRMRHVAGNHCLAVPPDRFFGIMGMPPYYSFASHGIRFVVLHGMEVSVPSPPLNERDRLLFDYHHALMQKPFYCGAVGCRQFEWLADELDTALRRLEPVVVLSHLPLLEETSDHKHGLLWNHEEVTGLLCRYPNVHACFSGHYHPGAAARRSGIHFIVVPGFVDRAEHPEFMAGTVEIGEGRLRIFSTGGPLLHDLDFVV